MLSTITSNKETDLAISFWFKTSHLLDRPIGIKIGSLVGEDFRNIRKLNKRYKSQNSKLKSGLFHLLRPEFLQLRLHDSVTHKADASCLLHLLESWRFIKL